MIYDYINLSNLGYDEFIEFSMCTINILFPSNPENSYFFMLIQVISLQHHVGVLYDVEYLRILALKYVQLIFQIHSAQACLMMAKVSMWMT